MANHAGHAGHMPTSGRGLAITGWLTGIYFVIELGIGLWSGSVSVTSDAFHTFSAVGGVLIAIVAGQFAKKGATWTQTYGFIRAEIIGALFNGLFLAAMAVLVLWMGAMRLMDPIHLPTGSMLLTAFGGIITEVIGIALLFREQKTNLNVRGAYWHVLQTFVGSLIIIVSAVVIHYTGFLAIDPLLGMAFGLVLFWASWSIIRDALMTLLEGTPTHLDLPAMVGAIKALSGVKDVHHVHAWSLTTGKDIFSAHVCIEQWNLAEQLRSDISNLLREQYKIYFSTIQLEVTCLDEPKAEEIDVTKGL